MFLKVPFLLPSQQSHSKFARKILSPKASKDDSKPKSSLPRHTYFCIITRERHTCQSVSQTGVLKVRRPQLEKDFEVWVVGVGRVFGLSLARFFFFCFFGVQK